MDKDISLLLEIYDVEEQARRDPECKALLNEYKAAYQPFWELWNTLPEEDHAIVDDYISAGVALYQHLMLLALRRCVK